MKIIDITNKENREYVIQEVVEILKQGGSAIIPTDTIYGLCANACDDHAVRMLYRIKRRSYEKALPIAVRNMLWLKEVAFVPTKLEAKLEELYKLPVTIVLPKRKIISKEVTQGKDSIAIRIVDDLLVDSLLNKFGYPLALTSANVSGEEGAYDPEIFVKQFDKQLFKPDIVLIAGKITTSIPTTIIDFTNIKPRILRVGPAKPEELEKILGMKLN